MSLLEIGVEVEKRLGGTKVRHPGLDPRGILVIIQIRVIIKRHALSKAGGERSQEDTRVEPEPIPAVLLPLKWVPTAAQQTRGLVLAG